MARAAAALDANRAAAPAAGGAGVVALEPSTDETILAMGLEVYNQHCLACHLDKGQGLVGPNLTDNYWIHDGSFAGTVYIINEGVPAKGMISWKTMLGQAQIYAVASYIYTLRGTDPPNPKAPAGEEYNPAS
jgi:cytochrome c oxidase cbb3-type subunit 3